MKNQSLKLVVSLLLPILSQAAIADDSGMYVVGDIGKTRATSGGGSYSTNSLGLGIGYSFNSFASVEASYTDFGRGTATVGTDTANLQVRGYQVSVLPSYPITSNFAVYGRLGYGQQKFNVTNSKNSASDASSSNEFTYGVGMRYKFTENWALRAEVQKPASDITATTVGVLYHF